MAYWRYYLLTPSLHIKSLCLSLPPSFSSPLFPSPFLIFPSLIFLSYYFFFQVNLSGQSIADALYGLSGTFVRLCLWEMKDSVGYTSCIHTNISCLVPKYTHTDKHMHFFFHTLSRTHSLALTDTPSLSHTHTITLSFTLSLSHSLILSHTPLSLSLSLPLTHTLSLSHSPSLSLTLPLTPLPPHTHTHPGMNRDCPELRLLLSALAARIDATSGKLDSQEIGNAL